MNRDTYYRPPVKSAATLTLPPHAHSENGEDRLHISVEELQDDTVELSFTFPTTSYRLFIDSGWSRHLVLSMDDLRKLADILPTPKRTCRRLRPRTTRKGLTFFGNAVLAHSHTEVELYLDDRSEHRTVILSTRREYLKFDDRLNYSLALEAKGYRNLFGKVQCLVES